MRLGRRGSVKRVDMVDTIPILLSAYKEIAMSSDVTRQKAPVAAAGQREFLRSAVAHAQNIEALGRLNDSVLLTTIKKGAGIVSEAKLAKTLRVLSSTLGRAAALLGSPESESEKLMQDARARGRNQESIAFRRVHRCVKRFPPSAEQGRSG